MTVYYNDYFGESPVRKISEGMTKNARKVKGRQDEQIDKHQSLGQISPIHLYQYFKKRASIPLALCVHSYKKLTIDHKKTNKLKAVLNFLFEKKYCELCLHAFIHRFFLYRKKNYYKILSIIFYEIMSIMKRPRRNGEKRQRGILHPPELNTSLRNTVLLFSVNKLMFKNRRMESFSLLIQINPLFLWMQKNSLTLFLNIPRSSRGVTPLPRNTQDKRLGTNPAALLDVDRRWIQDQEKVGQECCSGSGSGKCRYPVLYRCYLSLGGGGVGAGGTLEMLG